MFKNVKELAAKRTHLRSGVEEFMNDFAEKTKEVKGFSAVVFTESKNGYDYDYCMRTGKKDLFGDQSEYSEEKWFDYNESKLFFDVMPIADLRSLCENLERAIKEIQGEIDGECEAIAKILEKLS